MRVHLVDGTFELYRAHFSPRPRATARVEGKEMEVTAVRGTLDSVIALFTDPGEAATHVAIAFDNPIVSFRNALFDGYKSDEGVPPELRAQFDLAEEACRALGIVVWSMDEMEADDALATGALRWKDQAEVRLMTPDKDLGQCLDGTKVVQVDRIRKKTIDEAAFRAARGFAPESIPDFLALTGDTADGIPGIAGFGEKTAGKLLAQYTHLEPLFTVDWSATVRGGARLRETLLGQRPEVELYRKLATLRTDVPLAESLADLRWNGITDAAFLSSLGADNTIVRAKAAHASLVSNSRASQ